MYHVYVHVCVSGRIDVRNNSTSSYDEDGKIKERAEVQISREELSSIAPAPASTRVCSLGMYVTLLRGDV